MLSFSSRFFIYSASFIIGVSFISFKLYWDFYLHKNEGRTLVVNLSSADGILNTNIFASVDDTYRYLIGAYAYYKNIVPTLEIGGKRRLFCKRPLSALAFLPFMIAFNKYFPLIFVAFFTLSIMLIYAYIFDNLGIGLKISLFILVIISPLVFHHIPRLTMEPVIVLLSLLFLISFLKRRYLLGGIFIGFAGILRGEFSLLAILYGAYLIYKLRNLYPILLSLPLIFQIILSMTCGEQSGFYGWTYHSFYTNIKGQHFPKDSILACVENRVEIPKEPYYHYFHPYYKIEQECYKEKLINVSPWRYSYRIIENFIGVAFRLLFLPILPKSPLYKFPLIAWYIIYCFLAFVSLIINIRRHKLLVALYLLLVLIYTLYFPFGEDDPLRFKQYLIPFEITMLSLALKEHRFQVLKRFPP